MSSSSSPTLSQALLFNSFRTHCVFTDHSALIIHPSGECFTYFSPTGGTYRQLLRHVLPREQLKEKLMLSLHFRNMFSDEPIVALPELFAPETHSISLHKNVQAHWRPMDVISKEGNYSIKSVEGNAFLSLHPTLFLFKVEYKTLLETKTTRWFDEKNGIMKSGSLGAVPKTCFQYVTVSQVYSISQYPSRWSAPLFLLWQVALKDSVDIGPVREPLFPEQLLQFFSGTQPASLKTRTESFKGINFSFISYTDELITLLPNKTTNNAQSEGKLSTVKGDARLRQLFFNQNKTPIEPASLKPSKSDEGSQQMNSGKFDGWQEDGVMPTEKYIYGSYKTSNVALLWTETSTIRQTGYPRELQILIHADDSVLLGNGEVFEHWTSNKSNRCIRFFTKEAIPPISRNGDNQYSLTSDIIQACQLFLQPFHSNSLYLSGSNFSKSKKIIEISKGVGPSDEEVVCESVNPGLGHFFAFRNQSIKVIFEDRTVLRLSQGYNQAKILTRTGDHLTVPLLNPAGFQKHISAAQDFMVYAYATPAQ